MTGYEPDGPTESGHMDGTVWFSTNAPEPTHDPGRGFESPPAPRPAVRCNSRNVLGVRVVESVVNLRASLEREFPVDDLTFPWGTEVASVEAAIAQRLSAAGRPPVTRPFGSSYNGFAIPVTSVFSIPAVRQQVWAPAPTRPVAWVAFDLAAGHGLEGEAGLARLRPIFDGELDEEPERGLVATGKPNPYGVAVQWTSGSTRVHLWTLYEPRSFLDGSDRVWRAGTLRIEADEVALLAPYLDAKLRPQPWDEGPGEVTVIDAPSLQTGTRGSRTDRAIATIVDEYITPRWVADRLGHDQVAIWVHASAGVWGFGDARLSRVLTTGATGPFRLRRVRPARGAGRAILAPVITAPGAAGLDAAAQVLAQHGADVRVVEGDDE